MEATERIVRLLSSCDEPLTDGMEYGGDDYCALCNRGTGTLESHAHHCPWRLAREWTAQNPVRHAHTIALTPGECDVCDAEVVKHWAAVARERPLTDAEVAALMPRIPEFQRSMRDAEHARAEGRTVSSHEIRARLEETDRAEGNTS